MDNYAAHRLFPASLIMYRGKHSNKSISCALLCYILALRAPKSSMLLIEHQISRPHKRTPLPPFSLQVYPTYSIQGSSKCQVCKALTPLYHSLSSLLLRLQACQGSSEEPRMWRCRLKGEKMDVLGLMRIAFCDAQLLYGRRHSESSEPFPP